MLVYHAETPLASSAQRILLGDNFNTEQLSTLKLQMDATAGRPLRSLTLNDVAVIRLRLVENELLTGNQHLVGSDQTDLADLDTAVSAALAGTPSNSFLWLARFWLQAVRIGAADGGLRFLRMSYLTGPNEAWIAIKRNPRALSVLHSLPDELVEQVLSEFKGLVRSGLHLDASNIFAGSESAVREKLLSQLKESDLRGFAKMLEAMNLDGASNPGIGERPSRPF